LLYSALPLNVHFDSGEQVQLKRQYLHQSFKSLSVEKGYLMNIMDLQNRWINRFYSFSNSLQRNQMRISFLVKDEHSDFRLIVLGVLLMAFRMDFFFDAIGAYHILDEGKIIAFSDCKFVGGVELLAKNCLAIENTHLMMRMTT
jgi:hypothetical protein